MGEAPETETLAGQRSSYGRLRAVGSAGFLETLEGVELSSRTPVVIQRISDRAPQLQAALLQRVRRPLLEHAALIGLEDHAPEGGSSFVVRRGLAATWRRLDLLPRPRSAAETRQLALAACAQLAQAVAELHRARRCHGGLEPRRIFVGRGDLAVVDAEIAAVLDAAASGAQEPGPERPQDDLIALAASLSGWAGDEAGGPLAALLDRAQRGSLPAEQLFRSCAAELEAEGLTVQVVLQRATAPAVPPGLGALFDLQLVAPRGPSLKEEPPPATRIFAEVDPSSSSLPWYDSGAEEASTSTAGRGGLEPDPSASSARFLGPITAEQVIGAQLGPARIERLLGEGASSLVFAGRELATARPVALKVLRGMVDREGVHHQRLLREAAIVGRLDHPNIVRIHAVGEALGGHPFVVMDLLAGRSLEVLLSEEGPLHPERAALLLGDIARGLAAAHAAGVVHRDLKPANLMVVPLAGGIEQVKILDFGLSRLQGDDLTRLTRAGEILGTPRYMAPEQIRDASAAGPPCDLYALGVIAHRMLTGQLPFQGSGISEVLRRHLEDPPPSLPGFGSLGALVEALLAKRPSERPTAAAVLDRLPGAVPAPALEVATVRRPSGGPTLALTLSLLALLVGATGVTWSIAARSPRDGIGELPPPPRPEPAAVAKAAAIPAQPTEAEPRAEPSAEPRLDAVRPKAPRPPQAPAADPARAVRAALAKRALDNEDLERLLPGSPAVRAWRRRAADAEAAALITEIERAPIDPALVEHKAERLLAEMRKMPLTIEQARRAEERYFAIQERIGAGGADPVDLLRALRELQGDLRKELQPAAPERR